MTSKEIIKRLKKEGFTPKGIRGGSHQKWTHEDGRIVIAPHPEKDFKTVNKNLTISNWFNEEAKKCKINFSAVLKKALLKELNIQE